MQHLHDRLPPEQRLLAAIHGAVTALADAFAQDELADRAPRQLVARGHSPERNAETIAHVHRARQITGDMSPRHVIARELADPRPAVATHANRWIDACSAPAQEDHMKLSIIV